MPAAKPETVTIEAAVLSRAMKSAASLVKSTQTIPILANVRMEVLDEGVLEIVTSNLDIEYRQRVPLVSGTDLATTVDARKLAAIAGATEPGAQIAMEIKDGRMTARSGRSRWVLPILPVADFPIMPFDAREQGVAMPGKDLAALIARTAWATLNEVSRPFLSGIYLNEEHGKLRIAATTGFTLMFVDADAAWPADAPGIIVPVEYARMVERLAADADRVTMEWDDRKIRVTIGDLTVTGKVIEGRFPDYRRIIPQAEETPVLVDPETLRKALFRVSLISSEKTRSASFEPSDGRIDLRSADLNATEGGEEVPADCAPGLRTYFKVPDLMEAMDAIGGDTVEIHHIGPDTLSMIRRAVPDGAVCCVKSMIG